jgi:hypothetical protein
MLAKPSDNDGKSKHVKANFLILLLNLLHLIDLTTPSRIVINVTLCTRAVSLLFHIRRATCQHGMERPQVVEQRDGFQIVRITTNVM